MASLRPARIYRNWQRPWTRTAKRVVKKAFVRGVPLYAVLIGLEIEGRVEAGGAYFPALDEMIAAATGSGCWWNGRKARVSAVNSLSQAVITCTTAQSFPEYGVR